jgi:DNA mismatch repair protein MutS
MPTLVEQYNTCKVENPDGVLLMRVGDFYEAFNEDAEMLSVAFQIPLTARIDAGMAFPTCSIPHHSAERYITRLIDQGYRVALYDHVEDPYGKEQSAVRRRVLTPGKE